MNAETAGAHLSRLAEDAVTPVDAPSIVSDHWFVFRGTLRGGEFRCGCGLPFLNAHQLRVHVQQERGTAITVIPFGTETDPS